MNNCVEKSISELSLLTGQQDIQHQPVVDVLRKLTALMRLSDRSEIKILQWDSIDALAKHSLQILHKSDFSASELELLIELLRFLRNSCGGSLHNQQSILNNGDIFNCVKEVFNFFLQKDDPKEIGILKICIQLFGNILVGNETSKPIMWRLFFEENKFRFLLQHSDMAVQEYTMMVLFNCMSDEYSQCIFGTEEGRQILVSVTNTLLHCQIDWGILFIEYLLKQEEFLDSCYHVLPFENRLLVLDIMAEGLKNAQDNYFSMPTGSIVFIKKMFLMHISQIYSMRDTNVEPTETVSMLSILCSSSVSDAYISILQNSKDLLMTSIEALKCIHLLGKEGSNVFSSLSEAKHMNAQFGEQISSHPLYGFKKNLIRLIGNLCYACKENQDLVRQLDGIPLVLDCCKFDAKNPYITQWCILAIRNIMENNAENQAILSEMSLSGEIVDSKFLNEMGFQVQNSNGSIRIRPSSP